MTVPAAVKGCCTLDGCAATSVSLDGLASCLLLQVTSLLLHLCKFLQVRALV